MNPALISYLLNVEALIEHLRDQQRGPVLDALIARAEGASRELFEQNESGEHD